MKARDNDGGFALVQAVATLALSALVMLLMVTLSSLAARNSEVTSRRIDDVERFASGLSALRRDIESVLLTEAGPAHERRVLFFGDSDRVGLAVNGRPGERDRMVMVTGRSDADSGTLVRVTRPLAPDAQGFGGGNWSEPAVLVDGPWRFEFSYAESGLGGLRWRKSWPHPDRLPDAVRLDITGLRPGHRQAPPLVVPLMVDEQPLCAETRNCTRQAHARTEAD